MTHSQTDDESVREARNLKKKFLDFVQFFGVAFYSAKELAFNSFYTSLKVRGTLTGEECLCAHFRNSLLLLSELFYLLCILNC
jgi:hypothetical protein